MPPEIDLEKLFASYYKGAEDQFQDGPIPTPDNAQAKPLAKGAVPDMQNVDNAVEDMELDSSASPKCTAKQLVRADCFTSVVFDRQSRDRLPGRREITTDPI